jgi:hypothetical protein
MWLSNFVMNSKHFYTVIKKETNKGRKFLYIFFTNGNIKLKPNTVYYFLEIYKQNASY